jgi:hypothetical protein
LSTPFTNRHFIQTTAIVGDQTGTNLDNDAAGIAQYRRARNICHINL